MNARPGRTAALASVLVLFSSALTAQQAPERVAPPALAARLGLMPLLTTNVPAFRVVNPEYDGRGVVIGILDSGLDPSIPGLKTTTTGDAKILDLRDFSGEGRIALSAVQLTGDSVRIGTTVLRGAAALQARTTGGWYGGVLRERPLGEMPAADLNGDGDDADALPVLVVRIDGEWAVLVDRDGDGSLDGETPVRDFLRAREFFAWTSKGRAASLALAVNFATVPGQEVPALDLHFDTSAHGSHVAGIAAGHNIYDVIGFDGVAPGAWLLGLKISDNAQGGITTTGSMMRALEYAIRFARDRQLPLVLNMSFGVGNEQEGRARIDAIVDSVLAANPDVVFTISAGNDGPGLSTLGFPGSAERAISVGATMPSVFRPGATGEAALREPVASFSSRGGELAKPDIVTPGVAYSTVPNWNIGDEIKGGTSMASPHAAGLAARLVSGLAQRKLPIDAARVRLALETSARRVPSAELPDEGAGRPDLVQAWQWLNTPHDVDPLTVTLDNAPLGTSAFLRRGRPLPGDTTVTFTLRREQAGPERLLALRSTVPWLVTPENVRLNGKSVTVPVIIKRTVTTDAAVGGVIITASADTSAGVLARLGVTLLFPAPVDSTLALTAATHAVARIGVPVTAGRAAVVRVTSQTEGTDAELHLYEGDGQPWRGGATRMLGASDSAGVSYAIDGRDATSGIYELALRAGDAGTAGAAVRVQEAPLLIVGAARSGSVLSLTGQPMTGGKMSAPAAQLIGAEQSFELTLRAGTARRTPLALPSWVTRVIIDVAMPRAQWSRFTDFGVTLFDAEGRQLGKEPMNYPTVRLEVAELPDTSSASRTVSLGLFPGLADPNDMAPWNATITVRYLGEIAAPLRAMPGAPTRMADGKLRWRYSAPAKAIPALPEDALPLLRVSITERGTEFTHELPVTTVPTARARP